jgi:hypothetical protein
MRIAITGHTRGIGSAMHEWFARQGHQVTGFSRSTGFDLSDPSCLQAVAQSSGDHDILINNAYVEFAQVKLMYLMHDLWQGMNNKTHVIIGSQSPDWADDEANLYIVVKHSIDRAAKQLSAVSSYRITNIRPGYVNTARVGHIDVNKLLPADLAASVCPLIVDETVYITDMSLRVSNK